VADPGVDELVPEPDWVVCDPADAAPELPADVVVPDVDVPSDEPDCAGEAACVLDVVVFVDGSCAFAHNALARNAAAVHVTINRI